MYTAGVYNTFSSEKKKYKYTTCSKENNTSDIIITAFSALSEKWSVSI